LHGADDVGWQRDVAQLRAVGLTLGETKLDHRLQGLGDLRGVALLIARQPGVRDDGTRLVPGGGWQPWAYVPWHGGARDGGCLALHISLHELTGLVVERGHRPLRVLRVSVLDVADCSRRLLDQRRHPRIPLAADADREIDGLAGARPLLPVLADRAQMGG